LAALKREECKDLNPDARPTVSRFSFILAYSSTTAERSTRKSSECNDFGGRMAVRGVRGAIVVDRDDAQVILEATRLLLLAVLQANPSMAKESIGCAFFTVTADLCSTYPARAAREMGWDQVPMMCGQEIPVPGGLAHCIRIMVLWNTELTQDAVQHVYLGGAAVLRPDLNHHPVHLMPESKI
jgi:chorismate mutase